MTVRTEDRILSIPVNVAQTIRVGRATDNEMRLASRTVSRHHAYLEVTADHLMLIVDCGSKHGTFVNGRRIQPETPVAVEDGSEIAFGDEKVLVRATVEPTDVARTVPEERWSVEIHDEATAGSALEELSPEMTAPPEPMLSTAHSELPAFDDGPSWPEPDIAVGRASPREDRTNEPSEKAREGKMTPSEIRHCIRDALARLPLDSFALRRFHDAFFFRRSISTTNEGCAPESLALASALSRALTRSPVVVIDERAEPVTQEFKDEVIRAVASVGDFSVRFFARMTAPDNDFDEKVEAALIAYADHRENGLTAEPW